MLSSHPFPQLVTKPITSPRAFLCKTLVRAVVAVAAVYIWRGRRTGRRDKLS